MRNKYLIFLPVIFSILTGFSLFQCRGMEQSELNKQEIKSILSDYEKKQPKEFQSFLTGLESSKSGSTISKTIRKYKEKPDTLSRREKYNIYRLLGIYARLKYREQMIHTLSELVSFATFKKGERPQHQNPEIKKMGLKIAETARKLGLSYRNTDNRIFEVTLPGQGSGDFGIYTHGDVVPANPSLWVLKNKRKLNPYKMEIIGDKIYGRGTEDDKCSITSAMYAMYAIKKSGLPIERTIRLLIETTEETGSQGIKYYKKKHPLPEFNVVLDSSYPVVTAEKGFGKMYVRFRLRSPGGNKSKAEIVRITGGQAINQIPAESEITLHAAKGGALKSKIETLAQKYIQKNESRGAFQINVQEIHGGLKLRVIGVSAHSSEPKHGVNPVSRALNFLNFAHREIGFRENHYTDALKFAGENIGLD